MTDKNTCPDLNGTFVASNSEAYFDLVGDTMLINHMKDLSYTINVLVTPDRDFLIQPHTVAPIPLSNQIEGMEYMLTIREPYYKYTCLNGYLELPTKFQLRALRRDEFFHPGPNEETPSMERKYAFAKNADGELVIKITHRDWDEISFWAAGGSSIALPWTYKSFTTYTIWPPEASRYASTGDAKPPAGKNLIKKILNLMPQSASVAKITPQENARLVSFRWGWHDRLDDDAFVVLEERLLENFGLTVANKERGIIFQGVDILILN